ncbi:Transposable element Tc3 transposase [Porphyridium purpureum]|uniref:Transposable element Tc3 transposase n=1 Tax=Porphyridium purpureum TaxID=35688 RepID=A0A5J4Z4T0_PORPP|nr:Transposable element Tc3 transposase [Porphyridium purpureum]|eukprot:POR9031..scf295_1
MEVTHSPNAFRRLRKKKFNLDGPDGFHKTRLERSADVQDIWTRHSGTSGCMVWGAISARGKILLDFIEGTFTAAKYVSMLRADNVLDRCRQIVGPNMTLQQDNAPVHTSRLVKNFMNDENVELLLASVLAGLQYHRESVGDTSAQGSRGCKAVSDSAGAQECHFIGLGDFGAACTGQFLRVSAETRIQLCVYSRRIHARKSRPIPIIFG